MPANLATTNLFLGVLAVVSLLEMIAIVGLAAFAFVAFRRAMREIARVHDQQVKPALGRVNDILDDVSGVTGTVRREAQRADGIVWTVLAAIRALFEDRGEHRHHDRPM